MLICSGLSTAIFLLQCFRVTVFSLAWFIFLPLQEFLIWYLLCSFLPHAFVLVSSPLSSAVMVVKEWLSQLQPFLGLALALCVFVPDDG